MSTAQKDDNSYPALFGMSCVDGITPTRLAFNAATGGIKIDTVTVTSFTPFTPKPVDNNSQPVAKGVSSTNAAIILPWYINPANGSILIEN